jgi:disulfide oxidoreductase YuzD
MAKGKMEISVLGRKIPTKIEDIDIFQLKYWSQNPRVNSSIKKKYGNKSVTDAEIELLLKDEEHVKELLQDIKFHGGLIDEIVVKDNVVLEGNSRLCAYRLLYEKAEKANDDDDMLRWSYIKSKILPSDISDEEIFTILGTWHIKGKKQWDTFEKAAYLKKMSSELRYSSEKIGELISETKSFVENAIEAHDLMVKNDVYDLAKYSYFLEFVKNRGIGQEVEKDKAIRDKIISAIKNDQFHRAEEIRDVPKVLKDKVAKKLFFDKQSSFSEALETAIDRHPEMDDSLYNSFKKITQRISNMQVNKIEKIKEEIKNDTNKKDIVRRFNKEVKKFCKQIGLPE